LRATACALPIYPVPTSPIPIVVTPFLRLQLQALAG
jgi:hypothetical protein